MSVRLTVVCLLVALAFGAVAVAPQLVAAVVGEPEPPVTCKQPGAPAMVVSSELVAEYIKAGGYCISAVRVP